MVAAREMIQPDDAVARRVVAGPRNRLGCRNDRRIGTGKPREPADRRRHIVGTAVAEAGKQRIVIVGTDRREIGKARVALTAFARQKHQRDSLAASQSGKLVAAIGPPVIAAEQPHQNDAGV